MAASSHPSRRVQEIEREATSRSQVGRSRRAGGHSMATIAATAMQHQCSVGMDRTLSPAVGVEAKLVVAHRLLNNPSSVHASPSAAKEWHHDVDQLIVTAINTPHHEGGGRSWRKCIHAPPQLCMHHHLLTCLIRRAYCRALRRATSMMSSSAIVGARIVASPLSTTMKGTATSRAATSRGILNLLHQHERRPRRALCDPSSPAGLGGV
jgi:hypothetical protein